MDDREHRGKCGLSFGFFCFPRCAGLRNCAVDTNQLRRQRVIEARRIRDKIVAANDLFNEYDWFNRNHQEWFDRASNRGAVAGTATDESSTVKAERAVGELQKQAAQARLPPRASLTMRLKQ